MQISRPTSERSHSECWVPNSLHRFCFGHLPHRSYFWSSAYQDRSTSGVLPEEATSILALAIWRLAVWRIWKQIFFSRRSPTLVCRWSRSNSSCFFWVAGSLFSTSTNFVPWLGLPFLLLWPAASEWYRWIYSATQLTSLSNLLTPGPLWSPSPPL